MIDGKQLRLLAAVSIARPNQDNLYNTWIDIQLFTWL